jgi:hypothetical protein
MKALKQNKGCLLDFLMQSNSLNDILGILSNICENLSLNYLNPRIKHFKYFQFTFFGLMIKIKVLLEMMLYKTEFLAKNVPEFEQIHANLSTFQTRMHKAYALIHTNKMVEGKKEIIERSKEYQKIFENINKTASKLILK